MEGRGTVVALPGWPDVDEPTSRSAVPSATAWPSWRNHNSSGSRVLLGKRRPPGSQWQRQPQRRRSDFNGAVTGVTLPCSTITCSMQSFVISISRCPQQGCNHVLKVGGPIPWSGVLLPFYRQIRQVYPVWCSRLHDPFIKKPCKKLGVRPNFGEVRSPQRLCACPRPVI